MVGVIPRSLPTFFISLIIKRKRTPSVSHQEDTFVSFHTYRYPHKGFVWFLHAYTHEHSQSGEWCWFSNGLIPLRHPWFTMARNTDLSFKLPQQKKPSEVKPAVHSAGSWYHMTGILSFSRAFQIFMIKPIWKHVNVCPIISETLITIGL